MFLSHVTHGKPLIEVSAYCFIGFPFHNFLTCSDSKKFRVSVSTVQCYNHAGKYDELRRKTVWYDCVVTTAVTFV